MRHGVVEGEPGIFPEPIARFMRAVGRLFDRRKQPEPGDAGRNEAAGPETPDADDRRETDS